MNPPAAVVRKASTDERGQTAWPLAMDPLPMLCHFTSPPTFPMVPAPPSTCSHANCSFCNFSPPTGFFPSTCPLWCLPLCHLSSPVPAILPLSALSPKLGLSGVYLPDHLPALLHFPHLSSHHLSLLPLAPLLSFTQCGGFGPGPGPAPGPSQQQQGGVGARAGTRTRTAPLLLCGLPSVRKEGKNSWHVIHFLNEFTKYIQKNKIRKCVVSSLLWQCNFFSWLTHLGECEVINYCNSNIVYKICCGKWPFKNKMTH